MRKRKRFQERKRLWVYVYLSIIFLQSLFNYLLWNRLKRAPMGEKKVSCLRGVLISEVEMHARV